MTSVSASVSASVLVVSASVVSVTSVTSSLDVSLIAFVSVSEVSSPTVSESIISGSGEWDSPGGWQPFQLDTKTGMVK